jgi:hypothetical protein
MILEPLVPFDSEAQATALEHGLTFNAACLYQVLLRRPATAVRELIRLLQQWKLTEDEARAALAELELLGLAYTDQSTFRSADSAFYWAKRRTEA